MHFLLCDPVHFTHEGGQAVFQEAQQHTHLATHSQRGKTANVREGRAAITNINRWGDVHHDVSVVSFSLEDNWSLLQYCP